MTTMTTKLRRLGLAVGLLMLPALPVGAYRYDVGPNVVNQSASACRAKTPSAEPKLRRAASELMATNAPSGVSVFCPINRRNTTFYSAYLNNPSTPDRETVVQFSYIVMYAEDVGAGNLSCFTFAQDLAGTNYFGTTKYLCSTAGGCTTAPAMNYVGSNTMNIGLGLTNQKVVNYGVSCVIPDGSKLKHYEASITPNN